jgi:hypothetical protein
MFAALIRRRSNSSKSRFRDADPLITHIDADQHPMSLYFTKISKLDAGVTQQFSRADLHSVVRPERSSAEVRKAITTAERRGLGRVARDCLTYGAERIFESSRRALPKSTSPKNDEG